MKNVFFVILLSMYSSLIYSQRIQNKIWGCEYGANRADIISVIEKQGFKYIDQGDKIKMEYPVFGGMKFDYGYFYFYLNILLSDKIQKTRYSMARTQILQCSSLPFCFFKPLIQKVMVQEVLRKPRKE